MPANKSETLDVMRKHGFGRIVECFSEVKDGNVAAGGARLAGPGIAASPAAPAAPVVDAVDAIPATPGGRVAAKSALPTTAAADTVDAAPAVPRVPAKPAFPAVGASPVIAAKAALPTTPADSKWLPDAVPIEVGFWFLLRARPVNVWFATTCRSILIFRQRCWLAPKNTDSVRLTLLLSHRQF